MTIQARPGPAYAGFWLRLWATAFDIVLLTAATLPLLLWIYGLDSPGRQRLVLFRGPLDFLIQGVLPAVAAVVFWRYKSATPGKMLLSLRIVDVRTGGRLSVGQCVGRYMAYFVSMLPLGLGFLWIAFDKAQTGLARQTGRHGCRAQKGRAAGRANVAPRRFWTVAYAARRHLPTRPLTASTLFWKAARSLGDSSTSMIRSTPPAPRTTGTPT